MLCETTVQTYFPSKVYQHKEEHRHDIYNTSKYLWQMGEKYILCPPMSIDPIKKRFRCKMVQKRMENNGFGI